METIILHNIEGISRKSGTDEHGRQWMQFDVDFFAEQEPGACSICGAELKSGWMCLDDGVEEVCDEHVSTIIARAPTTFELEDLFRTEG